MRRTKNFFPALLSLLLLLPPSPVSAAGMGDAPPENPSAAIPGLDDSDAGLGGNVTDPDGSDTDLGDSSSGLDDNAADPDGSDTDLGDNTADPGDSGSGLDDSAADLDGSDTGLGGNTADPDGSGSNPGGGMDPAILQPFLAQYAADSARRQTDSGILRFALVASLAAWAGRTITQRGHR